MRRVAGNSKTNAIIRTFKHNECTACGGRGYFAPAMPSCKFRRLRAGWQVVERCDTSCMYENDLEAAQAHFADTAWIKCKHGGSHAIATSFRRTGRGYRR
jgi:hypothetical protein